MLMSVPPSDSRHGLSRRIHVALGQAPVALGQAPVALAVHRFVSPVVAAGRITCAVWPILVGTIFMSTTNNPPCAIASVMAFTIAGWSPEGTALEPILSSRQ
jgi:hypothetical protein